jgi:Spy/CpxP family protein refolding chaperone
MPSLWLVVLIFSLALNTFVAGGFFYSRPEASHNMLPAAAPGAQPGPEKRLEALVLQLGVDPETSRPFKEMRRGFRAAQQAMMAKNRDLGEAYWGELASTQPDQKHLQDLVDEMIGNRHTFQSDITQALVKFMSTLNPAQRDALVKIIEDRGNPLGAPVRNRVGN